jgi:hypothetical protein
MTKLFIIVLESGFVYIGELDSYQCEFLGESLRIKNGSNIRRWGTSNGLGELANVGKQSETILDFCGSVICPKNKVLYIIPVTDSAAKTYE